MPAIATGHYLQERSGRLHPNLLFVSAPQTARAIHPPVHFFRYGHSPIRQILIEHKCMCVIVLSIGIQQ